jgi:hypothetical protein
MRDEVPDQEKKKQMIQSPKLMLTFIWNLHGFCFVGAIPKGEMFTIAYDIRNLLIEIVTRRGER